MARSEDVSTTRAADDWRRYGQACLHSQTMRELNTITPAPGFNQVYYPGQDQDIKQRKAAVEGIEIVDDIYQYLISDALYNTSYETKNPFAQ